MGPPTGRAPVVDDIRPPQQPVVGAQQPSSSSVRLRSNVNVDTQQTTYQTTHLPEERTYVAEQLSPQQTRVSQQQQRQQQQQQQSNIQQQHNIQFNNDVSSNQRQSQPPVSPPRNPPQNSFPQDTQPRDTRPRDTRPRSPLHDNRPCSPPVDPYEHSEGRDSPDGAVRHSVNVKVDVCTEQEVCDSTPDLLTTFIVGNLQRDGHPVPAELRRSHQRESNVAHVLRDIGDDITKNYQLNHSINEIQVTPHTAYKTFASVASQIFADNNINWGRIVMLFYFAYKLALQCLQQLPLIEIIIGWVKRFVGDRLAGWISARGGWPAVREYYHSTNGQMLGMFMAGFVVASCFFLFFRRK